MGKKKIIISLILIGSVLLAGLVMVIYNIINQNSEPSYFQQYYDNKIKIFEAENETINNVDVVFIGDSITDGYDVKQYYSEINVLNRGIGGDTTFGVEKRLKVSLYDVNPKIVVMLIGINNLDTMLDNYEKLINKISDNLPNSKIVIISLLPTGKSLADRNNNINQKNVVLEDLSQKHNCIYVNVHDQLYDYETKELISDYSDDGLHPNTIGYEKITNYLKPIILKELEEC